MLLALCTAEKHFLDLAVVLADRLTGAFSCGPSMPCQKVDLTVSAITMSTKALKYGLLTLHSLVCWLWLMEVNVCAGLAESRRGRDLPARVCVPVVRDDEPSLQYIRRLGQQNRTSSIPGCSLFLEMLKHVADSVTVCYLLMVIKFADAENGRNHAYGWLDPSARELGAGQVCIALMSSQNC